MAWKQYRSAETRLRRAQVAPCLMEWDRWAVLEVLMETGLQQEVVTQQWTFKILTQIKATNVNDK